MNDFVCVANKHLLVAKVVDKSAGLSKIKCSHQLQMKISVLYILKREGVCVEHV